MEKDLTDFLILESGCNISDHHPITWSLRVKGHSANIDNKYHARKRLYKQRWDKADLMLYYAVTGAYLQLIELPKHLLCDGVHCHNRLINTMKI